MFMREREGGRKEGKRKKEEKGKERKSSVAGGNRPTRDNPPAVEAVEPPTCLSEHFQFETVISN